MLPILQLQKALKLFDIYTTFIIYIMLDLYIRIESHIKINSSQMHNALVNNNLKETLFYTRELLTSLSHNELDVK